MANELTMQEKQLVTLVESQDLGQLIQPLTRQIHLFDSFVAGITRLEDRSVLKEIRIGDSLSLIRENNKFDDNAIMIYTDDKRKLGYIPEQDNLIFARLMDAGKLLKGRISAIETKGGILVISVGIYLVDF